MYNTEYNELKKETNECNRNATIARNIFRQVANFTCKQEKTQRRPERKTKKHYRNNFYGLSKLALAYFVVFDFDIIIVLG